MPPTTTTEEVTETTTEEEYEVRVLKIDGEMNEGLAGASLQIVDAEGQIIDSWISDGQAHAVDGLKAGVTYTLQETAAPDGYMLANDAFFVLDVDGTINYEDSRIEEDEDGNILVSNWRPARELTVTKSLKFYENLEMYEQILGTDLYARDAVYYIALFEDADLTELVEGSVQELRYENSSSSTVTYENLPYGKTYYLAETDADGEPYSSENSIPFFYDSETQELEIELGGEKQDVDFANVYDEVPQDFYFDGQLEITKNVVDPDGKPLGTEDTFYAGIFLDENYTLPAANDGTVDEYIIPLEMNGSDSVSRKVQVHLTADLPEEAVITLYVTEVDQEGKPVENSFLINNTTYTVMANGGSAVIDTRTPGKVTITNEGRPAGRQLSVTKSLRYYEDLEMFEQLLGIELYAKDATYYVALFEDKDLTEIVDDSIKELRYQNSSSSTVTYDNLTEGRTYYLAEVDASGKPYSADHCIPFFYDSETPEEFEIELGGEKQDVVFANVYDKVPDDYYFEGQLTVTKKVHTAAGAEARSNGTFYAGIFMDPEFTTLASTDIVTQNIVPLSMDGGTEASQTIKVHLTGETPEEARQILYIAETDANGRPVNASGFTQGGVTYVATVSTTSTTVEASGRQTVTITNTAGQITPTPTPGGGGGSRTSDGGSTTVTRTENVQSSSAVRTGDDMPIGLYVSLLAAAALAILLLTVKKRNNEE